MGLLFCFPTLPLSHMACQASLWNLTHYPGGPRSCRSDGHGLLYIPDHPTHIYSHTHAHACTPPTLCLVAISFPCSLVIFLKCIRSTLLATRIIGKDSLGNKGTAAYEISLPPHLLKATQPHLGHNAAHAASPVCLGLTHESLPSPPDCWILGLLQREQRGPCPTPGATPGSAALERAPKGLLGQELASQTSSLPSPGHPDASASRAGLLPLQQWLGKSTRASIWYTAGTQ